MIKRVIALLKLKIKWKKRNQHNMTYLTNLCDIEQIHVGKYTYGPICVETFGCENTKLIIGQFCSVAQNVRFVLGGEHRLDFYISISGESAKKRRGDSGKRKYYCK